MSDSLYYYQFYAQGGDRWDGYFWDDTVDYNAGQWWYSGSGSSVGYYYISSEVPYGFDLSSAYGSAYNEGTVYTYNYYDYSSNANYTPYSWSNGLADGLSGPGSEYSYVWNGIEWDDFGNGGFQQASSSNSSDSIFYWTFYASTGDQWSGFTYDDSTDYYQGQSVQSYFGSSSGASYYGYYYISSESSYGYDLSSSFGAAYNEATTYTYSYYDSATGTYYTPYYWSSGFPDSYGGVGTEYDYVAKFGSWNDFGFGGVYQA